MVISFVSQKGGAGKSTLARGTAVAFINNAWDVHVADLDTSQLSTLNWANEREHNKILPAVDVATYRNPASALKATTRCDLLVIDGTPYASEHTKDVAKASTLVVIPTGITKDDLRPALSLAQEISMEGVGKERICFVVMKVPENGDKESMATRATIRDWGYDCAPGWLPFKTSYGQAMDEGYSMTETRHNTLNERADRIVQYIADKALGAMNNG